MKRGYCFDIVRQVQHSPVMILYSLSTILDQELKQEETRTYTSNECIIAAGGVLVKCQTTGTGLGDKIRGREDPDIQWAYF